MWMFRAALSPSVHRFSIDRNHKRLLIGRSEPHSSEDMMTSLVVSSSPSGPESASLSKSFGPLLVSPRVETVTRLIDGAERKVTLVTKNSPHIEILPTAVARRNQEIQRQQSAFASQLELPTIPTTQRQRHPRKSLEMNPELISGPTGESANVRAASGPP